MAPRRADRAGFEAMREAMRERFAPLAEQTRGFDPAREHLLGTSGTVTTLAAHGAEAAALQPRQGGCQLA